MLDNYKTCCICGKVFEGYGNDPWPIKNEGRCCDECNYTDVITAKIAQLEKSDKNKKRKDNDYFACVEMDCFWNDGQGKCVCGTGRKADLSPDKHVCKFYVQD